MKREMGFASSAFNAGLESDATKNVCANIDSE